MAISGKIPNSLQDRDLDDGSAPKRIHDVKEEWTQAAKAGDIGRDKGISKVLRSSYQEKRGTVNSSDFLHGSCMEQPDRPSSEVW
jgi:hypothetical protein